MCNCNLDLSWFGTVTVRLLSHQRMLLTRGWGRALIGCLGPLIQFVWAWPWTSLCSTTRHVTHEHEHTGASACTLERTGLQVHRQGLSASQGKETDSRHPWVAGWLLTFHCHRTIFLYPAIAAKQWGRFCGRVHQSITCILCVQIWYRWYRSRLWKQPSNYIFQNRKLRLLQEAFENAMGDLDSLDAEQCLITQSIMTNRDFKHLPVQWFFCFYRSPAVLVLSSRLIGTSRLYFSCGFGQLSVDSKKYAWLLWKTQNACRYKDSAAIMQLLRDNLALWQNDLPGVHLARILSCLCQVTACSVSILTCRRTKSIFSKHAWDADQLDRRQKIC